ncbi:MAG: SagB family peptide dehydrogenase [Candidatus Paceibacterota bacterium]
MMEITETLKEKDNEDRDNVTSTFRRTLQQDSPLSDESFQPFCLALIAFDGKQLILESAFFSITIQGKEVDLAFRLLKECDGTKNVAKIMEKFKEETNRESAIEFLESIQEQGFICDSREVHLLLHKFGCNPSPYFRIITDADIIKMLAHSHEESIRGQKETLPLPWGEMGLTNILSRRVSCREFNKDYHLPIKTMANLLWCMYGIVNKKELTGGVFMDTRTVPSGGGLYPLEVYIAITRDNPGLSMGIYRYRSEDHSIILCSEDIHGLLESVVGEDVQASIRDAGTLIIVAGHFPRSSQKYGNRGYIYTLCEAGAVMQNCYLAVSDLELGCCAIGGFREQMLSEAIGFTDYPKTMPLLIITAGKPKEGI